MEATTFRKLLLWGSLSLCLTILTPHICRALPFQLILERVDFKPDDGTDWSPKGYFKRLIPKGTEAIEDSFGPIELHGSPTPKSYTIENTGGSLFPPLDLSGTPAGLKSRSTFRARVEAWVQNLVLTPKTFSFSGHFTYEEKSYSFEVDHIHPCYTKPTGLTLAGIIGDINTDKLLLSLNVFNIRSTEYSPNLVVDISKKLPLKNIVYPLPHTLTPFSSGGKLICVPPKGPIVPREEAKATFISPYLPGIQGLEPPSDHLDPKEPTHTSLIGSNSADAYDKALATCIYAKTLPHHSSFIISVFSEDTEGFQATLDNEKDDDGASTAVGDAKSDKLDFASSVDSRSQTASSASSSSLEGAAAQAPTGGDVYSLLGVETRVESPYLYSDGQFMYLTQTIQQECGAVASKQASHFFKYTNILPFKVHILSNDLRLEASYRLPQGLYTLEDGLWAKIDDRYLRSTAYDDYKALPPKPEGLARSIGSFEKDLYPGLTQAHEFLGQLRDFIQPDPSTLEDDGLFLNYRRRIDSEGLLKTLTSIPEEHEHLITPLCLVVREDPKLDDPTLFRPEATHHGLSELSKTHGVCWGGHHNKPSEFPTLHSFLRRSRHVFVASLQSLIALPLISPRPARSQPGGLTLGIASHEPLSEKDYKNVARLLDLDQLADFRLGISEEALETDESLTISAFSQAIARQKNMTYFRIPNEIGLSNLKSLIHQGLSLNKSITEIFMERVCGDMPVYLLGELLSINTTLQTLHFRAEHIRDKETFNAFGRGLSKNRSLKNLWMSENSVVGSYQWCKKCKTRHLPGRSGFSVTNDVSTFIQALISFRGHLSLGSSKNETLLEIIPIVKSERAKVGLHTSV